MGRFQSMVLAPMCVCAVITLFPRMPAVAQDDPAAARRIELARRKAEAASPRIERKLHGGEYDYYLVAVFAKERRRPSSEPGGKPRMVVTVVLAVTWPRKGTADRIAGSLHMPPEAGGIDNEEIGDHYSLLHNAVAETPDNIDFQVLDNFTEDEYGLAQKFCDELKKALTGMPPAKAAGDKGRVTSVTVGHRTVDGEQQWGAVLQYAKDSREAAPAPFKESARLMIPAAYSDFDELVPVVYSPETDEDLTDFGNP